MAINRSPMQKKALHTEEAEVKVEPVVVEKEPVVVLEPEPTTVKKISAPKKKKPIKPKQPTDDIDTLIAQIKRCLVDGECEYEIPSQHPDVLNATKKIAECFRAEDYRVCVSVVPTGYNIKIKRA